MEDSPDKQSGTWLTSMGPELTKSGEVELANISMGKRTDFTKKDYYNIQQWIAPKESLKRNGLPSKNTIKNIQRAVNDFNPDIIQVWGTENYWGLLTGRNLLPGTHLLNMQGVLSSIIPVFYGNLEYNELLKSHGIRELIKPKQSLFFRKKSFLKRSEWEKEIINNHEFIVTQSEWVKAYVSSINNNFKPFKTERSLRNEFFTANSWKNSKQNSSEKPVLFTLSVHPPYKGLHVLIKALEILKTKFPDILLKIGGAHSRPGIRRSGYERWLRKLIHQKNLDQNIRWLGALTGKQIIQNLQQSNVFIHPSFVESYSLAVAEAMAIGTPSVVSFSAAMTELAKHEHSALYFSPGDPVDCARNIQRYLNSQSLCDKVSENSRDLALRRNEPKAVVRNQIDIYKSVLKKK